MRWILSLNIFVNCQILYDIYRVTGKDYVKTIFNNAENQYDKTKNYSYPAVLKKSY